MLRNGLLYEDELKKLYRSVWYDDRYVYYFGASTCDYRPYNPEWGDWEGRSFVSVDPDDESNIVGVVNYGISRESNQVNSFGAMNFKIDNMKYMMIYSRDLAQVVDDIFMRFNHRRMEWRVTCGNPIERSYDRWCMKLGGRIIGRTTDSCEIRGECHDEKFYEILKKEYVKHRNELIRESEV